MDQTQVKQIVEAALLAADAPISIDRLQKLFLEQDGDVPERQELRMAIEALEEDYTERAMTVKQVATGFRVQVREEFSTWVSRLWSERPPRYSRALLETLSVIAYRQPVTRGEIEDIRGVSVATSTMRTLLDRAWVRVVGQRDVPGKPSLYGSTREFLDYFGLKSLDELPTLNELRDFDDINVELDLDTPDGEPKLRVTVADGSKAESSDTAADAESVDEDAVAEDLGDDDSGDDDASADDTAGAAGGDEQADEDGEADDDSQRSEAAHTADVVPIRSRSDSAQDTNSLSAQHDGEQTGDDGISAGADQESGPQSDRDSSQKPGQKPGKG